MTLWWKKRWTESGGSRMGQMFVEWHWRRKGPKVDLTPPAVEAIARVLVIGLSMAWREGGRAVEKCLARAGCLAFDMGLATTPACFMSTILPPFAYEASIMMTASHPYTRNGLKFFTKKGGLTSPEVEEICNKAARKYANRLAKVSTMLPLLPTKVDFMSTYATHLRNIIKERVNHPLHYDTPLQGFQIIVNAGNGSGGFFTWDVLDKLGADTFGSLHLNPDGMFPNHIPNPGDKTAMALTRAAVLENSADLGIVFDTDVDRSGVVDNKGNPLMEHPATTIVTDARTGVNLNEDGIEAHLMMETSGHGALKENYFLDDGSDEGIGSLISDLEEPYESIELRMSIISELRHAKARGTEAIETFREYIEEGKLEGWELDTCGDCWVSEGCLVDLNDTPAAIDAHMHRAKVSDEKHGQHGWIHLRQSIHNPNIAVNMQSFMPGGCQTMTRVLRDKFLMPSGLNRILDISQIDKYGKSGQLG
ncbi:hypothetical protein FNV43_RR26705 [Rhamnella rubrinervis]|uniref:Phosphoglucomutase n=1 Tax=Rhamnella rubrinervis TaxID=2594499 RepID=A0A8K0DPM2_9ROSA|nr:hypothetical protein FNV43_RR26705 [Rhamnella rubrinervis]